MLSVLGTSRSSRVQFRSPSRDLEKLSIPFSRLIIHQSLRLAMGRKYLTPVFVALLAPWVLFLVWVPPAYLHRAVAAGDVKTLRRLLALPSTDVNAINRVRIPARLPLVSI